MIVLRYYVTCMAKKTNKHVSVAMQNECLKIMGLHIVQNICSDMAMNGLQDNVG